MKYYELAEKHYTEFIREACMLACCDIDKFDRQKLKEYYPTLTNPELEKVISCMGEIYLEEEEDMLNGEIYLEVEEDMLNGEGPD